MSNISPCRCQCPVSVSVNGGHKTCKDTDSEFPGSREILSIFMEADRHHSICCIECLFDAVPMMDVDINVQHS